MGPAVAVPHTTPHLWPPNRDPHFVNFYFLLLQVIYYFVITVVKGRSAASQKSNK